MERLEKRGPVFSYRSGRQLGIVRIGYGAHPTRLEADNNRRQMQGGGARKSKRALAPEEVMQKEPYLEESDEGMEGNEE